MGLRFCRSARYESNGLARGRAASSGVPSPGRGRLMCRIELVTSADFVQEASKVLAEAWPPTTLVYSPEYLAWQFSFPGAGRLPGVAAFDGTIPVGFAGVTCRRMSHRGETADVAVVSFVAVR